MSSIATKGGDRGQTSLAGGVRVSKSSLRVEAYGTVDEMNSAIGLARSMCADEALAAIALRVQRELFAVGSALATPAESRKGAAPVTTEMVDRLTAEVHEIEAIEGILADWSVPGGDPAEAAFDLARAVCRRAERAVVRLEESGEAVAENIIPYLNRLSDLLWLFGRKIDHDRQAQSSLREMNGASGPRWSRAW